MSSQQMAASGNDPAATPRFTRVFLNSRREAIVIFGSWFVALCWSVPYCYFNGYGHTVDAETFSTTLGMPSWLFTGILLPWIIADLFSAWVCFCFMKDDELGSAGDEVDTSESAAGAGAGVTASEGGAA